MSSDTPSPYRGSWTALALFAASLTPAILWAVDDIQRFRADDDHLPVALAVCMLVITAGVHVAAGPRGVATVPRSRLRRAFRALLMVTLALLWVPFLLDLLTARFGWTLLAVPACVALVVIAQRATEQQGRFAPWLDAALLVATGPLTVLELHDSWPVPVAATIFAVAHSAGVAARLVQLPLRAWMGRTAAGGLLLGLSTVWSLLPARADNGCTGVSWMFERALFLTPLALYPLGLPLLAEVISSGPQRHVLDGELRA